MAIGECDWANVQTYHAEDDDEAEMENVGNAEREAEEYAEHSGPIIELVYKSSTASFNCECIRVVGIEVQLVSQQVDHGYDCTPAASRAAPRACVPHDQKAKIIEAQLTIDRRYLQKQPH